MSQFHFSNARLRSGWSYQSFNDLMWALAVCLLLMQGISQAGDLPTYKPAVRLDSPEMKDQDDMCVWVHPTAPEKSSVICSDKSANALFVYDLEGKVIQHIPANKPGNIDIRQGVQIDGKPVDLVVFNQRDGFKLCVYRINGESRKLERADDNLLTTGPNYGGCLYHSKKSGRLYFICTSDRGTVEQYELVGNGQGGIGHKKVRSFPLGKCEGAVADDQNETLFIGEEKGSLEPSQMPQIKGR
jgi:3-phytase